MYFKKFMFEELHQPELSNIRYVFQSWDSFFLSQNILFIILFFMHEYDGVPCVKSLFFNLISGSKYKIQHDTWMLIQRTMLPIYIAGSFKTTKFLDRKHFPTEDNNIIIQCNSYGHIN